MKHSAKNDELRIISFLSKNSLTISISILLFVFNSFYAQELSPIQIFTPQDYAAGDQNWAISQGKNDFIYVANNKGLLEYNGANWQLHNSPNESILRSVEVIGDKIYTGGYMDFGYWIRNAYGGLDYTSLVTEAALDLKEDEEFWEIIELGEYIVFQSLDRIYTYNTTSKTIGIIDSEYRINKMYKVEETIYFQKMSQGIYKIENG